MTDAVWMYWEDVPGTTRAPYLSLCLETVRRHAGRMDVRVLDQDSVFTWLPDLDADLWRRLPAPNYRSDYARTRLVHRYGGLWLDIDLVAVGSLESLMRPLDRYDLAGYGRELGRFYSNLFAARAGSEFVRRWLEAQDDELRRTTDLASMRWAALAQDVVLPIARSVPYYNIPASDVAPVWWYEWRRFMSRLESPGRILGDGTVTVMLWNKVMGPELADASEQDLLAGRSLLSRLLRIGLGQSTLEDERDLWTRAHRLSDVRFSRAGQALERRLRVAQPAADL
jgi:capsular polysaccharide synthesis protein